MGFSDIGCFGAEIATPHIDALAADGLRFAQFYNSARCCPTRASLLTGVHPHQAGVGHMTEPAGIPAYQGYLNDTCTTIAEALKPAGYRTFLSGKWHVGGTYGGGFDDFRQAAGSPTNPRPIDRGFDHHWGTLQGAGSYYEPVTLIDDHDLVATVEPGFFYTDEIASHAIDFIARAGTDPYFLFVGFTAPHWPLHARPEDIEPYLGTYRDGGWERVRDDRFERLVASGIILPEWGLSPRDPDAKPWSAAEDPAWEDARMATYAAQITAMDRAIGRILGAVDGTDTLVLFLSDNGGCAELLAEEWATVLNLYPTQTPDGRPVRGGNIPGLAPGGPESYMSYDRSWSNASNTPFRLHKHWVHEGGTATPFLARWTGRITPGGLTQEPCHITDVMATCVEVSGAPAPAGLEGRSLLPLFADPSFSEERDICLEHEGNRSIRRGRFKLVSARPGSWELYDMETDRTELHDLADRYPSVAAELAAVWQDWATRVGVQPWDRVVDGLRAWVRSQR